MVSFLSSLLLTCQPGVPAVEETHPNENVAHSICIPRQAWWSLLFFKCHCGLKILLVEKVASGEIIFFFVETLHLLVR